MGDLDLEVLRQDIRDIGQPARGGDPAQYLDAKYRVLKQLPDILAALERAERLETVAQAIVDSARASDPGTSHEDDLVVNFALIDELRVALAGLPGKEEISHG